jgi:hypothetical protein
MPSALPLAPPDPGADGKEVAKTCGGVNEARMCANATSMSAACVTRMESGRRPRDNVVGGRLVLGARSQNVILPLAQNQ